jgi:hypothetical protein
MFERSTLISLGEEVTAIPISLAEERAKSEKAEAANQKLMNDLFNLSKNFDNLVRHSIKQKHEIESAKQALETSTK